MSSLLTLDPESEARVARRLVEHFTRLGYFDVKLAAHWSLSLEGAATRFRPLLPLLAGRLGSVSADGSRETSESETVRAPKARGPRLLVSGMGSGSEMVAARNLGFGEIHGTEVDAFYVTLVAARLAGHPGFLPVPVDGRNIPYADGSFDVVISGHIVEHTADPAAYVAEHLRVVKPGGYFLIEFPTRFHTRELHTGMPSLEWLPGGLRNAILRGIRGPLPGFSEATRKKARSILDTGLKQVSLRRVRRWASASGIDVAMIAAGRPGPGVVYALFERRH